MSKFFILAITVLFSFPALAEPIVFVCERPVWGDKQGCGPNNTHSTYAFHVETNDFRLKRPHYTLQARSGCEIKKAARIRFNYQVSGDEILFQYIQPIGQWGRFYTVRLNQNSLIAELGGVRESALMRCEVKESESWIINNPQFRR
jgi:hypothetical protein